MTVSVRLAEAAVSSLPHRGRYRLMGREILSDFPFRDLPRVAGAGACLTLMERRGPFPSPGALVREVGEGAPTAPKIRVFEDANGIQYSVGGAGIFWIEPCGTRVWYRLEPGAGRDGVEMLLTGPVLALAFQLQGQVQLHASAIAVGTTAVAFSAPHGAGKSTLAASFVRTGHALLTDDILPLDDAVEGIQAVHSLSRMKLWRDSLAALGENANDYELVLSGADKRRARIGQHWGEVAEGAMPLTAIYFLEPHVELEHERRIEFVALEPVEAILRLLSNAYMPEMLAGARAARALEVASRLVADVRLRRLLYRREFMGLPALRAAILADLRDMG